MLLLYVLGCVLLQQGSGLSLTDDELFRLPELFKLDKYYECLRQPGDQYCYVNAKLVGNSSNEHYRTLEEYSANTHIHFNRTLIHWGICVTQTCSSYLDRPNRTESLEACINSTLESYKLNARIITTLCTDYDRTTKWDSGDYAFAALVIVLLTLSFLGSVYDFYQTKLCEGRSNFVTKFLLCFAARRSWRQLLAPHGTSSKTKRLKCINGFRTISTFFVILGHSSMPGLVTSDNPEYIEKMYSQLPLHIIFNGSLIMQTFFIMSGLLAMYSGLVKEERSNAVWKSLSRGVCNRWLRLTPPYVLVMFFIMTLGRHVGDGPLWKPVVTIEVAHCYDGWWRHLLYIQNYFDHDQCMPHAWYLACDFQLNVVGLVIVYALSSARARKIAIAAVFVVGLLTPAGHVFMQNLNAILIASPEMAMSSFVNDPTYNNLYKRGHTNVASYVLGLALALLIYDLKESDIGSHKFKKFRLFYWMLFPIEVAIILTGATFYIVGIEVPLVVRMVYSSAVKVLFGGMICFHIFFTVLKVDKTQRGVLNWPGWGVLAKLTFSAYIAHTSILRTYTADNDALSRMTTYKTLMTFLSTLCLSFAVSLPLWLFVETPSRNLVKTFIFPATQKKVEKTNSVTEVVADIVSSRKTIESKL